MTQAEATKTKDKKTVTLTCSRGQLAGYTLALLGLMVWLFILGVLVGRGDVNYWLQRWGWGPGDLAARLAPGLKPSPTVDLPVNKGQTPEASAVPSTPVEPLAPDKPLTPAAPLAAAAPTAAEPKTAPAKAAGKEADKPPAKKTDGPPSVASKLNFQNDQDRMAGKTGKSPKKLQLPQQAEITSLPAKPKATTAPTANRPPVYQVRVGEPLREAQQAQKVVTDLKKKGVPVTLQQKKDSSGTLYVISTNRLASRGEAEKIAQKLRAEKYQGVIETLKP